MDPDLTSSLLTILQKGVCNQYTELNGLNNKVTFRNMQQIPPTQHKVTQNIRTTDKRNN